MNPANAILFLITFLVVAWGICMIALSILALGYMEDLEASDPDKAFIISVLVISSIFVLGMLVYTKYRYEEQKKSTQEALRSPSGEIAAAKMTKSNAWRDGVIGFLLAVWCAMSVSAASMMISYREKKPNAPESDKNFAIACIVISILVFLLYVTSMFLMYRYLPIIEELSKKLGKYEDERKRSFLPYGATAQYVPMPMPIVQPMYAGFPQYVAAPTTPPPSPPAAAPVAAHVAAPAMV